MSDDLSRRSRAVGRAIATLALRQGLPRRLTRIRRGLSAATRSLAETATSSAPATESQRTTAPTPAVAREPTARSAAVPDGVLAPDRTRTRVLDLGATVFLAACAVFLHRDGLVGDSAFYELDTRLFYYPLAAWVGEQLHNGLLPLWQPQMFTGYPLFADGELGLAYLPQVLLLTALPAPLAMVWLRVLHAFLAGLFTYLYLRIIRLDPLPALGGALIFAFGSFLTAQMHHENIVRSAVWLPAVLACAAGVMRGDSRRRLAWIAAGAIAFAQAGLGLHVQPMLMIVVALALYGAYGVLLTRQRAWRPLVWLATLGAGGLGLAAVQLVPLIEWALVSTRRAGVTYEFASAFEIAPTGLISLIFPYFYRLPDATTWWSLWQQWEIELYVGIPTLALIVVGIVFGRRLEILYFVALAALALLIAMAQHAPLLNLHQVLWSVPGFSFLRAPARFSYLAVFACAGLAALGLQALAQRRLRILVALVGGLPASVLLAALLALLPSVRNWLLADSNRALEFVSDNYLAVRAQYSIDPQVALAGLLAALDFGTPKTAWSLSLLGLTCLGCVVWLGLGYRRAVVGQTLFVGLLAIDLLTFASDFHPRTALASLNPALPSGVTNGSRILLRDPSDLPSLEPDAPIAAGVSSVQGYSSLPSQRHVEVEAATRSRPDMFDLWSAPFVIEPLQPADGTAVQGVSFRLKHPLLASRGSLQTVSFALPASAPSLAAVRLIGALSYAFAVPQGQPVATMTIGGWSVPLRAGIELSERAFDRPSLRGVLQHQRAPLALGFEETTSAGETYTAHLYLANLTVLTDPTSASPDGGQMLTIAPLDPNVELVIHGIGLVDANGVVQSLDLANRAGFRRLSPDVIENTRAMPRAFVLPRSHAFGIDHTVLATHVVTGGDFDPHRVLLIEGDPTLPPAPADMTVSAEAASIQDLGPDRVTVSATAASAGFVVLDDFYQRDWSARVDGQPADVYIANALFRAVAIAPGDHVVEFRFQPGPYLVGAAISAMTLVTLVVLVAVGVFGLRLPPRRHGP